VNHDDSGSGCGTKLLNRGFRQQPPHYRKRTQDTHSQESPSGRLTLIFIEATGDQQAEANTKRNSSSSDQHDFWDRNRSLR